MYKHVKTLVAVATVAVMMIVVGCSHGTKVHTADVEKLRAQINDQERQINTLKNEADQKASTLNEAQRELKNTQANLADTEEQLRKARMESGNTVVETQLLPPNAKAGECYARLYIPPVYKTVVDTVLKSEASERVEVVPARYEWVEERVLVTEASSRLEEVPAKYEWVEERVLVREAHTEWKKGNGLIEKVDEATGEIMCLVEVPAEYKTVRKRVMTEKASTREITIPAEYETVKVKKMVSPPKENRIAIPAEYQTLTRVVKISEGHMEWRPVLCETNLTQDVGRKIQHALLAAGHHPGPIDGVIGALTHAALKSYQQDKNLAQGGLTFETMRSLGINL